jgi:signal transduction histidine kinase
MGVSTTVTDLQVVPVQSLPEALARTLRHEMGDFLQKVYASVAILESRLPAGAKLERDLLARLRGRAESCKQFLDAVQDFLSPLNLDRDPIDLGQLARQLVETARRQYPNLDIVAESNGPAFIAADVERMLQVGEALLTNACEAARCRVVFRTDGDPAGQQIEWTIRDDGPGIAPHLKGYLFRPFFTTRPGHPGLGLALAQKLVSLHGGRLTVANLPQGGFCAQVFLPISEITQTIPLDEGDTRT